jgi:formate hydrogenlyase subunit 3/multisubunit Na+/H+ antiporter MnhD subunit
MVLLALACAAVLIATAALALLVDAARARVLVYGTCLAASSALFLIALFALSGGFELPAVATLPLGIPWLGAHFRLDALAAFFLAVVNLGAAVASLFALGYGRHEHDPRRVLPFYPAFLAGMSVVVLADDAFTFLVSWEFMSLSSWALVMAHHRVGDNIRAGYVYLIMASFGTLALLLTFGLLAGPDGGYAFADMRGGHVSAGLGAAILVLALVGAGSKAGLVPLHVWLPLAHPAAPSHVSALMSGVMTKVAVYGFVRIVFDLLGTPTWWWSMLVLGLGEVDAGSCNGCELEIHALNNAFYDLERFGLRFVASPRHADMLLVTGPVTRNMREALERTYNATPDPKWVVAVGDCARDGGLFAGSYAVVGGASAVVPVDLHIRGCPPRPVELLKGLLALLEA